MKYVGLFNPDENVEIEVGGIVFLCKPPVDDISIKIWDLYDNSEDVQEYQKATVTARKELTAPGKKVPSKKKLDEAVLERAKDIVTSSNLKDPKGEMARFEKMMDMVIVGWTPKDDSIKLPAFPTDGKPSRFASPHVKQGFSFAYMETMRVSEDEVKN